MTSYTAAGHIDLLQILRTFLSLLQKGKGNQGAKTILGAGRLLSILNEPSSILKREITDLGLYPGRKPELDGIDEISCEHCRLLPSLERDKERNITHSGHVSCIFHAPVTLLAFPVMGMGLSGVN